jgi:hypothetical protein
MADDGILIDAWRGGDQSAAQTLIERHYDGIARFFASEEPPAPGTLAPARGDGARPRDARGAATVRALLQEWAADVRDRAVDDGGGARGPATA